MKQFFCLLVQLSNFDLFIAPQYRGIRRCLLHKFLYQCRNIIASNMAFADIFPIFRRRDHPYIGKVDTNSGDKIFSSLVGLLPYIHCIAL